MILTVVGARPNFVKAAALCKAFELHRIEHHLVHTGQHYDDAMSAAFFRDLELPDPIANLAVGSGSHAKQTAEVMLRLEPVIAEKKPKAVIVVGDVNSTLGAALCSTKMGIPTVHVEAGLRCSERIPEEINRRAVDAVCDLLLAPSGEAGINLTSEMKAHTIVGNVMVDTLLRFRDRIGAFPPPHDRYAVATIHRPENTDNTERLFGLLGALGTIAKTMPVYLVTHPRAKVAYLHGVELLQPQPYIRFLGLVSGASVVLTDSGGLQEETTVLGVPCRTLRATTERMTTVSEGSNKVIGTNPGDVVREALTATPVEPRRPAMWDGVAADRCVGAMQARGLA